VRLYKIHVKHYSPKDSHEALQGFLVAESDEEVFYFVKTKLGYSTREELDEEFTEEVTVYDESYNAVGTETVKQRIIRNKGEMFDSDTDVSDAYYGVTHYGWDYVGTAIPEELHFLRRMDLLLDEKIKREEEIRQREIEERRKKAAEEA
jgi:hypothetical protein